MKLDLFYRARRRAPVALAAALVAVTLAACGEDATGPDGAEIAAEWFESIDAGAGASVDVVEGDAPEVSGGPSVFADLTGSFITGGTTQLAIGGETFDGLVLALDGVKGYIDVDYSGGRTSSSVAITLYSDLPTGSFSMKVAGREGSQVGQYVTLPVNIVQVGSGVIQVSVSWDTPSDVDLHVVDPSGDEIYYGSPFSETGGELDLDSNAGCGIDGVNNENITWADGDSPTRGEYIVRVDYWDSCGSGTTSYIVTVRVEGKPTRTYTGTLTGEGTGGSAGAGVTVATFDY